MDRFYSVHCGILQRLTWKNSILISNQLAVEFLKALRSTFNPPQSTLVTKKEKEKKSPGTIRMNIFQCVDRKCKKTTDLLWLNFQEFDTFLCHFLKKAYVNPVCIMKMNQSELPGLRNFTEILSVVMGIFVVKKLNLQKTA